MMTILEDDSTSSAPRVLVDQPGPQNLIVVDWAAASVQGSQRLRNEDTWNQLGPVFVLADGMGGMSEGHQASAIAGRSVVAGWLSAGDQSPVEVVRQANAQVRANMASQGVDGGSTLSALRIAHDQATIVHVGDSRVYRLRDGHAELLSRDHNLRSELLAAGIVPRTAQAFGPLQALTSYLGMPDQDLQIDVRSVGLRAGDRLVLCTDGVSGEMSHSEFTYRASDGSARNAANLLTSHLGHDDATAVVVEIGRADA